MTARTAVVLLNLGGPLAEADIRPYLFNFFMDSNIIAAPWPVRRVLASLISRRRAKGAAHEAYGRLGFRSPLLDNTRAQSQALEEILGPGHKVFVAMRYWHPFADETAREVAAFAPDETVLIPLYPQYSTATVKSALEDWARAARRAGLHSPVRSACCWFTEPGYIAASVRTIRKALDSSGGAKGARVLFSAHGLPERTVKSGDPYQWQCEESAKAIAAALEIPALDWRICYQSRVGPLKWIGPSTEEALAEAARDGKRVVIYPHAFVSEHVETLVEIEIEYRALAAHLGVPGFTRAVTAGTDPDFIAGLARLAKASPPPRRCPAEWGKCGCRL